MRTPDTTTVAVYIPAPNGSEFGTTVSANSSKRAMFAAVEVFMLDWWKGPKPRVGMVLRISVIYRRLEVRMRVTAEMIAAARAKILAARASMGKTG